MATPHNYFRSIAPQIFRKIVQKRRRRAGARQVDCVQYDEKDASKRTEKALAGNCAVLPYISDSISEIMQVLLRIDGFSQDKSLMPDFLAFRPAKQVIQRHIEIIRNG